MNVKETIKGAKWMRMFDAEEIICRVNRCDVTCNKYRSKAELQSWKTIEEIKTSLLRYDEGKKWKETIWRLLCINYVIAMIFRLIFSKFLFYFLSQITFIEIV